MLEQLRRRNSGKKAEKWEKLLVVQVDAGGGRFVTCENRASRVGKSVWSSEVGQSGDRRTFTVLQSLPPALWIDHPNPGHPHPPSDSA